MNFIHQFSTYNLAENLFSKTDKIVVAFSGGCDSMVLAHVLHAIHQPIVIAHCNFKLRGDEADADENFAKNIANDLKVPFHSIAFETEKFATENKISIQQAARELRYNWFEDLRKKNGFDKIATAHHLNDSIETFFINLLRGTGINGLTGIPSKNEKIIRPLLFTTRNEIEAYAKENELHFRNDSSNLSDDYLRNKLRHHVLPLLQEINPSFEKTMQQNVRNLKDAKLLYDFAVEKKSKKLIAKNNDECRIDFKLLMHQTAPKTLLFELLQPFGFNHSQTNEIVENKNLQSGSSFFSASHKVLKHRNELIIVANTAQIDSIIYVDEQTKIAETFIGKFTFQKEEWKADDKISTEKNIAMLDADKIEFPLLLRTWKRGDYFYPLGMNRKKKKLSDFFIQEKLSLIEKEKIILLCEKEKIIWVAGKRIDDRFKITNQTKNILKIKLQP